MAGSYLNFGLDELRQKYAQAESPYNEFLRRRGMSVGLYVLPVGVEDKQTPHMADEVYVVLQGRGRLRVVDEETEVVPGRVISVDHGEEHQFIDVTEDLHMLVFFAPPDLPDEE
jgi:mannose-6-phosphate isomerase-like protein (cupin superfamily)